MNHRIAKILSIVALETFEKLAFIFGTFEGENPIGANADPTVAVKVSFRGAFSGSLGLCISESVLPELAANMLGIDESGPIGIDHQQDALREVANVICGRMLPLIGGKMAEFALKPPMILKPKTALDSWNPAEPIATVRLDLDDGGCDLVLVLEGALPEPLPPEAIELTEQDQEWDTV